MSFDTDQKPRTRGRRGGKYAVGYSLQFFHLGGYDASFWDGLTPEVAAMLAERAKAVKCKPNPNSKTVHGVHVAWFGPSQGKLANRLAEMGGEA